MAEDLARRSQQLLTAVQLGDYQSTLSVLSTGIDCNLRNSEGDTFLHTAAQFSNGAIPACLIQHKADVNAKNEAGWTPLHVASAHLQPRIVGLLLNHKADVNAHDKIHCTSLHLAVYKGFNDIVSLLLEPQTVNLNQRDDEGMTVLHRACETNNVTVVQALLKHPNNVDMNVLDNRGVSALEMTSKPAIQKLLKKAMAGGGKKNSILGSMENLPAMVKVSLPPEIDHGYVTIKTDPANSVGDLRDSVMNQVRKSRPESRLLRNCDFGLALLEESTQKQVNLQENQSLLSYFQSLGIKPSQDSQASGLTCAAMKLVAVDPSRQPSRLMSLANSESALEPNLATYEAILADLDELQSVSLRAQRKQLVWRLQQLGQPPAFEDESPTEGTFHTPARHKCCSRCSSGWPEFFQQPQAPSPGRKSRLQLPFTLTLLPDESILVFCCTSIPSTTLGSSGSASFIVQTTLRLLEIEDNQIVAEVNFEHPYIVLPFTAFSGQTSPSHSPPRSESPSSRRGSRPRSFIHRLGGNISSRLSSLSIKSPESKRSGPGSSASGADPVDSTSYTQRNSAPIALGSSGCRESDNESISTIGPLPFPSPVLELQVRLMNAAADVVFRVDNRPALLYFSKVLSFYGELFFLQRSMKTLRRMEAMESLVKAQKYHLKGWTEVVKSIICGNLLSPQRVAQHKMRLISVLDSVQNKMRESLESLLLQDFSMPNTIDETPTLSMVGCVRGVHDNLFAFDFSWETPSAFATFRAKIRKKLTAGIRVQLDLTIDSFKITGPLRVSCGFLSTDPLKISFKSTPEITFRASSQTRVGVLRVPFQKTIESKVLKELKSSIEKKMEKAIVGNNWFIVNQRKKRASE